MELGLKDLEIGDLYEGWWYVNNQIKCHQIWLREKNDKNSVPKFKGSMVCFFILDKLKTKMVENTFEGWYKILTVDGSIGWVHFYEGCHWFKKLAGEDMNYET